MLELEFAELHGPIFLKGTNLPAKLSPGDMPGQRRDIKLFYDRKHRELHVHFKDKIAIVPRENVASMVEKGNACEVQNDPPIDLPVTQKRTAQVDGPMHHVFAGEGHGKLRDK